MQEATATTRAFGDSALKSAHMHRAAYTTLGFAAVAVAGGIGFAMKAAADAAIAFESSFAGVRKTVEASEAEFAVLEQGMRDLAKTIPVNVNELNRIGEAAGQLGVSKGAILSFTETVAKLGVTTNIVGDEAATAMARIANVMQTPQDQFEQMGSTIVALGNAGASTEAEIVEMAMRIAGAGQVVGLTEAEVLGFANALSSVGIEAQMGGSAISRVFIEIADNVASGGDKLEMFADVAGMSATQFKVAFEQDAAGAMVSFIEGLGRMDAAGENVFGVLDALGLSEIRVRDAMLRAANAGDLFRESIELGSVAWEENTALNEEAAKRFDTTAAKMQLMSNRLNDVAIGFGQLMLPAIAAVVGAIGDFADFIGSLPAPVKTVVIVLAAVAAAMLAISGATLLLLPRLAAAKGALDVAGVQGGVFRGSLMFAAKAINPLTVGLAAATIVLGAYASSKAEAKRRVEEFTAAIEADTGALGENTRALLVHELQSAGLLATLKGMGENTEQVTDNILAMADGNEQATQSTLDLMHSMGDSEGLAFAAVLEGLIDSIAGYTLKTEAAGDASDEATHAIARSVVAASEFEDEVEDAATAADIFTEALDALAAAALGSEGASLRYLNAVAQMREELKKGKKTLDDSTQAGRDNRQVILDTIMASLDHAAAIAEKTGNEEKAARVAAAHVREIMAVAREAGIADGDIAAYIKTLNLTPKKIRTLIEALGIPEAEGEIGRFFERWNGRVINVRLGVTTPSEIGSDFHRGGVASNEVLAILQRGEHVTDAATAGRHRGLLRALPRLHQGGPVPGMDSRGRMGGGGGAGDAGFAWLDRQFARLERAMDEAADLIKNAIDSGLSKAHLATARELSRTLAERQRKFDRLLENARDHLRDIRGEMRGFRDAIRSQFTGASELVGGLADAFRQERDAEIAIQERINETLARIANTTDPEELSRLNEELAGLRGELAALGGTGLSPEQMQAALQADLKKNQDFAAALKELSDMGLDPALLAEFTLEDLPFMQALIAGGADMVQAFNDVQAAIDAIAKETGDLLADSEFGAQIERATERLGKLNERMAEVMDKLRERLLAFLEAVRVDAVKHKVDDLEKALARLVDMLNNATSPGGGNASAPQSVGVPMGIAPLVPAGALVGAGVGSAMTVNVYNHGTMIGTSPEGLADLVHDRLLRKQGRNSDLGWK